MTLSRDLNVRTIDNRRLYELADRTDSFAALRSGRFDVDEETLRRSSSSTDEAFVPQSFVDISAEYEAALERASTLLGQTAEVVEASSVVGTFAQQGGRRNLEDSVAAHDDFVSLAAEYYDTADDFRDVPVRKLPSDYRDYHQRRIGVIETIADRLLRTVQYQESLVTARLPTGETLSTDSTLDATTVEITPMADDVNANVTISKMADELERTAEIILRLKRISEQGTRILNQHERAVRNS